MSRSGFYDENKGRGYPLLQGVVGKVAPDGDLGEMNRLPLPTLVDFGCLMSLDSGFDEGEHYVYLDRVQRTGDAFDFTFRSTAPGLHGTALVFSFNLTDDLFSVQYATSDDTGDSDDPSDTPCEPEPDWSGFLVIGELAPLAELIGDGEEMLGGSEYRVEPSLIRSLVGGFVRSISLANADRTRAEAAAGCRPYCRGDSSAYNVVQECLQGHVRFQEGYNCAIRVDAVHNSVEFAASVGAGAGEPCEEVPVFPGETAPLGSELLTGGPQCNDLIRSINGLGGQRLKLRTGRGLSLTAVPEENLLKINLHANDTAACDLLDDSQDECDEEPDEEESSECDCGPE